MTCSNNSTWSTEPDGPAVETGGSSDWMPKLKDTGLASLDRRIKRLDAKVERHWALAITNNMVVSSGLLHIVEIGSFFVLVFFWNNKGE